jgi:hypothetical protein
MLHLILHWSPTIANRRSISRVLNHDFQREDDERLISLVAQGASTVRAAAAFRRTTISVRNRARSLGCPFPTMRQKWASETRSE